MFYDILNNLNKYLKFTIDCDEEKHPFLDVMVMKRGDNIKPDV